MIMITVQLSNAGHMLKTAGSGQLSVIMSTIKSKFGLKCPMDMLYETHTSLGRVIENVWSAKIIFETFSGRGKQNKWPEDGQDFSME